MQAQKEIVHSSTEFFRHRHSYKSGLGFNWVSSLLKGAIFALVIGGAEGFTLTNPLVFSWNTCLFSFLTDPILINETVRDFDYMWKEYWKLFGNQATRIMLVNGTEIANAAPGLNNVWSKGTCLLTYLLQSNCSQESLTDYLQNFSEEFKDDKIYQDLACKGVSPLIIAALICMACLFGAIILHMVCYKNPEQGAAKEDDSLLKTPAQEFVPNL